VNVVWPIPRANDSLQAGVDWLPLGFFGNGKVEGGSSLGFGITASELNYDDYAGLNATGKIAIALQGTPDGDNPHGQFADLKTSAGKRSRPATPALEH
jgi:hypothetical protein